MFQFMDIYALAIMLLDIGCFSHLHLSLVMDWVVTNYAEDSRIIHQQLLGIPMHVMYHLTIQMILIGNVNFWKCQIYNKCWSMVFNSMALLEAILLKTCQFMSSKQKIIIFFPVYRRSLIICMIIHLKEFGLMITILVFLVYFPLIWCMLFYMASFHIQSNYCGSTNPKGKTWVEHVGRYNTGSHLLRRVE